MYVFVWMLVLEVSEPVGRLSAADRSLLETVVLRMLPL